MNTQSNLPLSSLNLLSEKQAREIHLIPEREDVPLTFKDFTHAYSWPKMGSLRKMAFESEINGLRDAFLKVGRRRLVLANTLFRLLKKKGSQ